MADTKGTILAIDQGTTNTKAILINAQGEVVVQASLPVAQQYPYPAWVEQDAQAIWQSVYGVINTCLAEVEHPPEAIALTNQRESVLLWERQSGQPLGPVVVWQCRRTSDFCARLREKGLASFLAERTGLATDPLFSGSKMNWLLEHCPDSQARTERGELALGTIDSWLIWNLTGGQVHACDFTNASRTQLFDIHTREWSAELLNVFGISANALPEARPSSASFGTSVALGRLPAGVPIVAVLGDSHAALFGQAGFQPGVVKATYGTGTSLMAPMSSAILSRHGLSTTIAWAFDREHITYALEGNISATGAAVQWVGEFLGLEHPAEDVAQLATRVGETGGLYLVPAFIGLGAPYWNDSVRGLISGITRGSSAAHLARAALEAVAYQVRDVFDCIQAEAPTRLEVLLADGGASHNPQLMQFQADLMGLPVIRNATMDASALGVAYFAGLAIGWWQSLADIKQLPRVQTIFEPRNTAFDRETLYAGWQAAVARALLQERG